MVEHSLVWRARNVFEDSYELADHLRQVGGYYAVEAAEHIIGQHRDMHLMADEIERLTARIATLEADRAEWVEVERLRMGKLFGWHEPTWRKVAKWANREWHEYTGPDHVKARLLLRQQWLDAGGSMDGEKAPPTPPA